MLKQENLGQHSPACSFHLWSSGSESFSYPWCLAVIGTTVEVSQLEKCLSKGERGSTAPCLLLQSKDTQTQSYVWEHMHTCISLPRYGSGSSYWQAARVMKWMLRSWGVEALSSFLSSTGQLWKTSTQLLWWGWHRLWMRKGEIERLLIDPQRVCKHKNKNKQRGFFFFKCALTVIDLRMII